MQLAWFLAALGIGLRLEQYFHNRSLWMDEALVGLNLIHHSLGQLTHRLDYHVVAPLAWLFAAKASNVLFGNRELALRLPVILSGVAAVVVILFLGKRLLSTPALCVAVGLFSLSRPLIYYSSELKPYGSDPAVCAVLWLVAFWTLARPTRVRITLLGLTGAVAVWCSHTAVFVASGLGLTILGWCIAEANWRRLVAFAPALLFWGVSFGFNYWFFVRASSHDPMLLGAYGPLRLSLWHFADLEHLVEMVFAFQQNPITILLGVSVFAFVAGCVYCGRKSRVALSFLLSPLFFALLASSLHLYPTWGRFYLFFTPAMVVLIAAGVQALLEAGAAARMPLGTVAVFLLFLQPLLSAREVMTHPIETTELRPVLAYVQAHQQATDAWYVYCHSFVNYEYYAETYGMKGGTVVLGACLDRSHPQPFPQDAAKLHGRRVWVLVTPPGSPERLDEFPMLLNAFDSRGVRLDTYWRTGAAAFLYQMKP
ncbi:MAG: hypothetical protein ACM3PW_00910 [Chlamydiota bacterium]